MRTSFIPVYKTTRRPAMSASYSASFFEQPFSKAKEKYIRPFCGVTNTTPAPERVFGV
jgi:hypothetical protein